MSRKDHKISPDELREITIKRPKKLAQEELVLQYMLRHGRITALDAQREFGCMRLAARIADLKKHGHDIHQKRIAVRNRDGEICRVAAYELEEET